MYEGRLNDLGLLGSCGRADRWRSAAIAVGRAVVRIAVCCLTLRVRLVCRRKVLSICTRRSETRWAHGRGRGRRDVHSILWGRERARGRQDGNRPVHIWVVIARKRASAGLCDRSHRVETRLGRAAAMLRCWAAKPGRPLNSTLDWDGGLRSREMLYESAAELGHTVPRCWADWQCGEKPEVVPEAGNEDSSRRSLLKNRGLPKYRGLPWRRTAARELACSDGMGDARVVSWDPGIRGAWESAFHVWLCCAENGRCTARRRWRD